MMNEASSKLDLRDLKFTKSPNKLNNEIQGRQRCIQCGGSRRFICYRCNRFVLSHDQQLHIKHPSEKVERSSAVPLQMISPQFIKILTYPNLPNFSNSGISTDDTVLLFPSSDSVNVKDVAWSKYRNVIAIDSSWLQTAEILNNENLVSLQKVSISSHKTLFWRFQFKSDEFLSTAEAIYFLFTDYYRARNQKNYDGRFDDLLFFFALQYQAIMASNNIESTTDQLPSIEMSRQRRLEAQELNRQRDKLNKEKREQKRNPKSESES